MEHDNFSRMIRLADEFFAAKNDPEQLDIDETIIAQLHTIHPAAMGERSNENGPIAWTIVIPTTHALMEAFLAKAISEKELFNRTLRERTFTSLYLCSALVLPEFRRRGLIKDLVLSSLREIQQQHPITELFCWAFSKEGKRLAETIAESVRLPLYHR